MKQHHYLFDSLDDLQRACNDLEFIGVEHQYLHVAYASHLSLEKRHLNDMGFWRESDLLHTALRGLIVGIIASVATGAALLQWLGNSELGLVVSGFVSLIVLGFCTWVGGMIGVSHDNWRVSPYHDLIQQGKSLLIVDVSEKNEPEITRLMAATHREAEHTGESSTVEAPWVGGWQLHLKEESQTNVEKSQHVA